MLLPNFIIQLITPKPGYSEQDPEIIWQAFVNCINEIINKIQQVPVALVLAVLCIAFWLWTIKTLAITPLITWADTRSEKIAEGIRKSTDAEKIYKETGTPIHSMSPLCKIKWLKENDPRIFKNAFKFISIKEFIWFRLFKSYQADYSIASATGLFNIDNLKWNKTSLQLCDITASHLSGNSSNRLYSERPGYRSATAMLDIPADTTFCIGASDGCLANIGSHAMKPGIAALTIGTSGAVRVSGTKQVYNYNAMIFNYVLDKNTFISGGDQ